MDRVAGYSPWGRKESDTAERLTLSGRTYCVPRTILGTLCNSRKFYKNTMKVILLLLRR